LAIKGSCCCGGVRFELFGRPEMVGLCHCSRCRKAGSSVYAYVRVEAFSWVSGRNLVARYAPQPPHRFNRCFCGRCGTALGDPFSGRILAIAAGCLDEVPSLTPDFHEYVADQRTWRCVAAREEP